MADSTDRFCQLVKIVKTGIVALKCGYILWPRGKDKQCAISTCFEATSLRFPVLADGLRLNVYQTKPLFQGYVLYPFLTFGDAWGYQHIATPGCRNETLALCFPESGILCGDAVRFAMSQTRWFLTIATKHD
jgi:hypothetical protein